MVLIASIQCHHGDTGGGVPGGYNVTANDIWGEGVRWPVREGDRPRRRAARRAVRAAGQQPHPELHRRPARADRRRAARRATGSASMIDRYGAGTVEESVDYMIDYAARRFREEVARVARRRLRGRRVRRPRPARQPRHPPAREDHRRRRRPHDRLHGLATRARDPGVVDVRQHPRLHGRPDRVDDGSGDPEERGLLRPDQARRAAGLRAEPARRASR